MPRVIAALILFSLSPVSPVLAQTPSQPPATPAPASQPASAPAVPEDQLKMRALEEHVNELKEKIFRAKARLVLLQEAVLHGSISGSRAVLVHSNKMGASFKLEEVQYSLDGTPIYAKTAVDGIDQRDEFEIFNGSIVPGTHEVSVYLVFRGNGFGVFAYLNDYHFKVKSSYTLIAEDGKQSTVKIVAYEKGGATAELKDRPAIRYDVEVQKELRGEPAKTPESKK